MPTDVSKLDDEIKDSLRDIIKSCDLEDKDIRKAMMRQWRKNEEFWHGVQFLFWDSARETWRSPVDINWDDDAPEQDSELGSFSDKVVDIFKAHGESIIAALAAQLPALRYLPDDADSDDDTLTARTYNKIGDLIQRHNKSRLLYFRALFFLAIQGLVASYRYKDSDPKYGVYEVPEYGSKKQDTIISACSDCGYESQQDWVPEDPSEPMQCPQCGSTSPPENKKSKEDIPVFKGNKLLPKTRVKIDLFGPSHFKVSCYARNQAETNYFGLFLDQGKDTVCEAYPDLVDDILAESLGSNERFGRMQYADTIEEGNNNLVTVQKWWLRPAAYYRETDSNRRDKLLKKFPKGIKVVLIGESKHFAEAEEESIDDRWEIGQSGLSTYIHSDPFLLPIVQIQEMRNQLVNLIMEVIEQSIPTTFADPEVLNFDQFGKFEVTPGHIYKAKPARPGDSIGSSFYSSSKATLSRELQVFLRQLDQDAQFSLGSFPSIYGGPSEGKSRTFAEYAASRQMALQRLQILNSFVVDWWVRTIDGAVRLYAETVAEDQKFTVQTDNKTPNYINVWIRRSQMEGKIGGVESESSETFPVTLAQKKDLILKLMELNNEYINEALYQPENARIIQDVLAMSEMKLPGETQRMKQLIEINKLLRTEPIADGVPSIPINMDVDDHQIHIAELRGFMADVSGMDAQEENPMGYANLVAHLHAHQQALIQQTLSMAAGTPPGQPPQTAQPKGVIE